MTFQEFLKGCKQYKDFILIEEYGNKEEIERVSRQHGKKQKDMFCYITEKQSF